MDKSTAMKALVALLIIGALVGGTIIVTGSEDDGDSETSSQIESGNANSTAQQQDTSTQTQQLASETSDSETSVYADGTYSATGEYTAPPGIESVGVTITIVDDVVTDVSVDSQAEHPKSQEYQGDFVSGIAELVSGVSLDDADVGAVSGSSLTSNGFNDALDKIRNQARS